MDLRIAEPEHLLEAMRVALRQGGTWLVSRVAPHGPILRERHLSYVHKAAWGLYAAGMDRAVIHRLLDWTQEHALRDSGDFYFDDEPSEYKDLQRVYRPLTFGKVAAWLDHPVLRQPGVLERIHQYQHASGGVFNYVGDDPDQIEQQPVLGSLNTTFFGHLMLALDDRERAVAAGEWVRRWVEANAEHMGDGRLYTCMTPDGDLVTEVAPGEALFKVVDLVRPKQEFWNVGTAMAWLAVLYEALVTRWDASQGQARPYLDAARQLLAFEARMPLETYLWPSKCKVGWGAGELLRVLVEHGLGDEADVERCYRVAERVAIFTFLDNQLPTGGWPPMHYPLSDLAPEMAFGYKPLKGTTWFPPRRIQGAQAIWLPPEEITGEFLGEMEAIVRGVAALVAARRRRDALDGLQLA
ncbi:MAG: hypothetical protein ACODAJ_10180 [Planctomycetota bacterium]